MAAAFAPEPPGSHANGNIDGVNTPVDKAQAHAEKVKQSRAYRFLVRFGLVAFGLVHLLIGWLGFRLALGESEEASQTGALRAMAEGPLGQALMWVVTLGFVVITIWQLLTAFVGWRIFSGFKRTRKRLSSVARAVVYAVLGFQSFQIAAGMGTGESGETEQSITATLMEMPFGRVLVAVVGLVILVVGVNHIVKGVKDKYEEELQGTFGTVGTWSARLGHIAKGISIGIVGLLFGLAAWTYDPESAGGLDQALQSLREAPFGPWLLIVVAVGLGLYGIYCFFWARRARFS